MSFRDNRTVVTDAESLTGWNFSVNNNARSLFSADPDPIQGTNHIGMAVSSSVQEAYFDLPSSISTANKEFYFWVLPQGIMNVSSQFIVGQGFFAGVQAVFGDGSQRSGYLSDVGSNNTKFRYNTQDPNYVNFNIGFTATSGAAPLNRNRINAAYQGTDDVDPNFTAITQIGVAFQTLADAKGGTENCFVDKIVYSDFGVSRGDGLTVYGTTTLNQVYTSNRDVSTQAGIIREVGQTGSNLYGIQGRLYLGDSATGVENTAFTSTNDIITFESITNTNGFTTQGGTGTTTSVIFGSRTGTGTGNNGVTIQDLGTSAQLNFSDPNVDSVGIYGSIIRDITDSPILFDSAVGTAHEVFQTDFIGCTNVQLGRTEFNGCGFFNSVATGADSAAVSIIDVTNVSNLFFSSGGTGHAISIDSAIANQTFTFTNFEYTGYASTTGNTGNEVLINNSGQPITVEVNGGNTPTIDSDGVRGKVTVINNAVVNLTRLLGNTEVSVLDAPSPYSWDGTGGQPSVTTITSTETISANTFTGDNTNYYQINTGGTFVTIEAVGTAVFSNFPGVLQDTNATAPRSLADGDKIRVIVRDNVDNPTLQLFDEFEVDADPTAPTTTSIITKTLSSGFTSAFGSAITAANSKTVTVEKVDARYQFTTPVGNEIDILAYRTGSLPILNTGTIAETGNVPLIQSGDRNYNNPA